jgi:hypothetical protein
LVVRKGMVKVGEGREEEEEERREDGGTERDGILD